MSINGRLLFYVRNSQSLGEISPVVSSFSFDVEHRQLCWNYLQKTWGVCIKKNMESDLTLYDICIVLVADETIVVGSSPQDFQPSLNSL